MPKQKDLSLLKEELLLKKEKLLEQANNSQKIIKELITETAFDEIDYAEISSDSNNLNTLRTKQLQEIEEIDSALEKMKNGSYGICEMCDEKISIQRLRIKPHARFCVECRPVYEKNLKEQK